MPKCGIGMYATEGTRVTGTVAEVISPEAEEAMMTNCTVSTDPENHATGIAKLHSPIRPEAILGVLHATEPDIAGSDCRFAVIVTPVVDTIDSPKAPKSWNTISTVELSAYTEPVDDLRIVLIDSTSGYGFENVMRLLETTFPATATSVTNAP